MYSALGKVKIVEFYEATNSVVATQRKFCQRCNVIQSPSSKAIESIVVKFKTIETVRLSVIEGPKKSYLKRVQALNMRPASLLIILKTDLKLLSYKWHAVQQLSNADKKSKISNVPTFSTINLRINVWFTDYAHFHFNRIVNSQSCRI